MSTLTRIMITLILAIGMMAMTSAVQAQTTTWYVDDDAPCDPGPGDPGTSSAFEDGSATYPFDAIQEGLDAADGGDTVLVRDGIYSGFGNTDLDLGGKAITLVSENGPYNSIIYLRREGRGFIFQSVEKTDATVDGFFIGWGLETHGGGIYIGNDCHPTITNCIIHGCEAEENGGGIYCTDLTEPEILNCLITENVAGNGAGLYLGDGAAPEMTGTQITGNHAFTDGGGIYCAGNNDISDCTLSENHANEYGGGIKSNGESSAFEGCTLTYNSAPFGGGFNGYGQILDCTIYHSIGSGVLIRGFSSITGCEICYSTEEGVHCNQGTPAIENCLIAGSGSSGVLCDTFCQPVFETCLIINNHSDDYGGGIHCAEQGDPEINHCTVAHNSAVLGGGGIYCYDDSNPLVTNSIFWDNNAPVGPEIYLREFPYYPSSLAISYSDVEGGESAAVVETDCMLFWMRGMQSDDPLFADPDGPDDDVLTWEDNDYHLSDGSPCIEAGDPFYNPKYSLTDIDGEPRKVDVWVDMGADEYIAEGAIFTCSITCLTPVVHPGGEITFQTSVQNVTNDNQTARYTYNVYLCNGNFLTKHRSVSPVAFSPYLTKTEDATSGVPSSIPRRLKDCDLRYELVVSKRVSGKVLCTSSCYFQIQDGPVLQPQFDGE